MRRWRVVTATVCLYASFRLEPFHPCWQGEKLQRGGLGVMTPLF